jgi:hypothetical protein
VRPGTDLPDDFLIGNDAVGLFAIGWRVLYTEVCLPMARRLIDVLDLVVCTDQDIQRELRTLQHRMRQQLAAGTPWREAESLDAVMSLDMSAWAGLVGHLGECPVLHAVVAPGGKPPHRIEASAFEFIAGTTQLERVHAFMRELPELLQR